MDYMMHLPDSEAGCLMDQNLFGGGSFSSIRRGVLGVRPVGADEPTGKAPWNHVMLESEEAVAEVNEKRGTVLQVISCVSWDHRQGTAEFPLIESDYENLKAETGNVQLILFRTDNWRQITHPKSFHSVGLLGPLMGA